MHHVKDTKGAVTMGKHALGWLLALWLLVSGGALAEGSVTVYTAHHPDIVRHIVPWFEREAGIRVNLVRSGSSEVIHRIDRESRRPQADVAWSIGPEPLEAHAHLLAPFVPAEIQYIDPTYMVGTHWLPYTGIPMVLMVNTDLVAPEDVPTTWQDLADPSWEGKIVYAGADVSGSSFTQLMTILFAYGEEEGWELVEQIMHNADILASSGQVPRGVSAGRYHVGITLEAAATVYVMSGAPVKLVYPAEGTSAAPDGIALVKDSPNPENGGKFIDFVLSREVQAFLVAEMHRRSVRIDVDPPDVLIPLVEMKLIDYDLDIASKQREAIIARWREVVSR